ncbi:uncharacterized protein I303_104744 [Kwoniella dejecticola CBS 10117]|uniref:Abscisic acid G-protein coupled receptor-domain-containing protein n=1 Tax=Kwoniella dejecticola CBS 10117 TaxID=1296121 RepID=A0A1A6A4G0_9TREE|nr:uncharacterized protein I303_04276 [Kwoniella dejecticola CBS 10117]OBR84951.1 hypothetical protein I303_04276 [Kwoniella dejecticola CBS 10117]
MEDDITPPALTTPLTASATSPILLDTLVLLVLRIVYFFLSRRFLLAAVNPRLRNISQPEQLLPSTTTHNNARRENTVESDLDLDTEDEALLGGITPTSSYPGSPIRKDSSLPGGGKDYVPRAESYLGPYASSPGSSTPNPPSNLPSMPREDNIELQQLGQKLKEAGSGVSKKVLQLSHGASRHSQSQGTKATKKATRGLHRFSRVLFGICFAEGCNLLTLVVFHAVGILHSRSRRVNFSVSLHVILGIVLLVVPLVQCLLLTYRSRESSSASTTPSKSTSISFTSRFLISLIPFTLYIFLFTRIPPYITAIPITPAPAPPTPVLDVDDPSSTASTIDEAIVQWSTSGPEGWEEGGWLAPSLGRVVVLGVLVLGSLSGFGAVRTAWNFFEHTIGAGSRSLTDNDILQAERSLYRVRHDLVNKKEEITRVDAASGTSTPARGGWMGRMFGSQNQEAISLQAELSGLKTMEHQVSKSLKAMKLRKKHQDFGQTFRGQLYNLFGYVFAIYCAARLLMCLPSLFFAPLTRSQASGDTPQEGKGNTNGDWISFLLALAISKLPAGSIDIDVPSWSRSISIILTGVLIMSSLAQVMRSLNKVLRLTSKTVGAGFLLLSLGQLFATYVISLLVQLRTSLPPAPLESSASTSSGGSIDYAAHLDTSQTDHSLLSTLPDFRVFGRLFDVTFLFAALGTAVFRYVAMKVNGADDVGEVYRL